MNDRFRRYFTRRTSEFKSPQPVRDFGLFDGEIRQLSAQVVDSSLAFARAGVTTRIRPDAQLLLYSLADELLLRPYAYDESGNARPVVEVGTDRELLGDLQTDVIRVVNDAAEHTTDEITSHSIIDALGRVWDQLRTGGLDVWG